MDFVHSQTHSKPFLSHKQGFYFFKVSFFFGVKIISSNHCTDWYSIVNVNIMFRLSRLVKLRPRVLSHYSRAYCGAFSLAVVTVHDSTAAALFQINSSSSVLITVAMKVKWSEEQNVYRRNWSSWQRRLQTTKPHEGPKHTRKHTHTSNEPHTQATHIMYLF